MPISEWCLLTRNPQNNNSQAYLAVRNTAQTAFPRQPWCSSRSHAACIPAVFVQSVLQPYCRALISMTLVSSVPTRSSSVSAERDIRRAHSHGQILQIIQTLCLHHRLLDFNQDEPSDVNPHHSNDRRVSMKLKKGVSQQPMNNTTTPHHTFLPVLKTLFHIQLSSCTLRYYRSKEGPEYSWKG
jgi:hypothetical protein